MKILTKLGWKFISSLLLIIVNIGFVYFETSLTLRVMAILLSLIGLFSITTSSEIYTLVLLYLGLYDLYNIRYGLAVPLFVIIIAVFCLAVASFYIESRFNKLTDKLNKNVYLLYLLTTGLIILEIFLTMSFWPVDPKIKSMVIIVVFYLVSRIFYMYITNVLHLKKVLNYIVVSMVVLGIVLAYNMFYG